MEEIEKELQIIQEELIKKLEPLAIILFGSYTRNTQNDESDIDIAYKGKKISKIELFEFKQKLENLVNRDIDLIDLDEIGDDFRYEILMNGTTLYCKDSYKFDMYKIDMFREYLELNESRQSIINNIKNGGTIYGK